MKNQTMFGTYTSSRQTVIPEDQKRYNGIIAVKKKKKHTQFLLLLISNEWTSGTTCAVRSTRYQVPDWLSRGRNMEQVVQLLCSPKQLVRLPCGTHPIGSVRGVDEEGTVEPWRSPALWHCHKYQHERLGHTVYSSKTSPLSKISKPTLKYKKFINRVHQDMSTG